MKSLVILSIKCKGKLGIVKNDGEDDDDDRKTDRCDQVSEKGATMSKKVLYEFCSTSTRHTSQLSGDLESSVLLNPTSY